MVPGWIHFVGNLTRLPRASFLAMQQESLQLSSLVRQQDDQIQRTLFLALIPVVVAFSFFFFIFYRSRREAFFKQREMEFKVSIAEGELKALRAQMSPHFIFNCLNSIYHYIQANRAQGGDYLIKFSQLIRHVLETSSVRMVPLVDEIEANRIYIQLEQLRLNHSFDFSIDATGLDIHSLHIPPMVIQPFVENSIWHGLNQRGAGGRLDILFKTADDRHIQCVIADNGIAGVKSDIDLSHVVKKTSLGMVLIRERLDILNRLYNSHADFEAGVPKSGEGKLLTVTIPFEN